MAENIEFNYGWLKDAEGNNFAPKTTTNQVYTSTGETLTGELGAISDDVSDIKTQKGTANGLASLDSTGKVPSSQLPPSLALGETASTAFRGDQGKIAYTHANAKGSAFTNGLYKFTTNAEGHVTEATAVTKEDITALGIDGASQVQSDWEQTDNTKSDFIKNKPNIKNGTDNKGICTNGNTASAEGAAAIGGFMSKATGMYAFSTGMGSEASGIVSFAEGSGTASGSYSHSEGLGTQVSGSYSHAEGQETKASGQAQHVQGKFNIEDIPTDEYPYGKYVHIVGGGTSDTTRRNLHTIDWSGNAMFEGEVEASSIILKSPNETKYKITVSDDGTLNSEAVIES